MALPPERLDRLSDAGVAGRLAVKNDPDGRQGPGSPLEALPASDMEFSACSSWSPVFPPATLPQNAAPAIFSQSRPRAAPCARRERYDVAEWRQRHLRTRSRSHHRRPHRSAPLPPAPLPVRGFLPWSSPTSATNCMALPLLCCPANRCCLFIPFQCALGLMLGSRAAPSSR